MMLRTEKIWHGESWVFDADGRRVGSWLGEKADIDRLVELSNRDEMRSEARKPLKLRLSDEAVAETVEQPNEEKDDSLQY